VSKNLEISQQELVEHLIASTNFKPEFINRFDDTIVFEPLSEENLRQVVGILLSQINGELSNQKITVSLDDAATVWLSEHGYDPVMGARPLRRLMQKTIESIVANKILAQEISPGDSLIISATELEAQNYQ
jgi:ATP-dependent Clp protease ATP-binding subunit ClpA